MEVQLAGLIPDVAKVLGQGATAIWAKSVKCYKVDEKGPWYILYKSNLPLSSGKNGGLRCEMRVTNYKKAIAAFDQKINGIHAYALVNARYEIVCIQANYTKSFEKYENIQGAIQKWRSSQHTRMCGM